MQKKKRKTFSKILFVLFYQIKEKRDKILAADPQQRNKIKYDYADLLILDIIGSKSHPSMPEGRLYKMEMPLIKSEVCDGTVDESEYQEHAYLDQSYEPQYSEQKYQPPQYHEQYQDQQEYQEQSYKGQEKYSNQQYQEQHEEPVEEYVEEEVLEEQEVEHQQIENADLEEECPDEPIISMTTEDGEITPTYPVNYLQKLSQSVDANTSIPAPITVIRKSLNFGTSPGGGSSSSGLQTTPPPSIPKVTYYSTQPKPSFLKTNSISISRKRSLNLNPYRTFPQPQEEDLEALQKNKIRLEIKLCGEQMRLAERERYKMDLELLKLERELDLPPSKFTRNFISHNNKT